MAIVRANAAVLESWVPGDRVRLLIGSENASSLAASTPAGGTVVADSAVGTLAAAGATSGGKTVERRVLPEDKCAVLPIGVDAADAPGNDSAEFETWVQLNDAPDAATDPLLAATANPNEALLTWTASPDV